MLQSTECLRTVYVHVLSTLSHLSCVCTSYVQVLYGVVGSQRQQVNVSADELQVELTLLPVTEYYFAVGAVNRRGTGELSHRETITTKVSGTIHSCTHPTVCRHELSSA